MVQLIRSSLLINQLNPARLPDAATIEAVLARLPSGADEVELADALTKAFPGFAFSAAGIDDQYWRDMRAVLSYVRERYGRNGTYRYHPNELYDSSVARLFKNRLHQYESCRVCYAVRGSSDRTKSFADSLVLARDRFAKQWDKQVATSIEVTAAQPFHQAGLQAVDYMLWALQRHYARQESRFLEMVWDKVSLIHAVDETDKAPYGVYYSKTKPLVGAALKNKVGI